MFGVTWEWDGAHWTARQDIGVSARFGHAMAFDTVRQRVVLFGGLAQPDNADPAGPAKGDTWEHADIVNVPTGPGLASLDATPSPVVAGQNLTISVQLAALSNATTVVDVVFSGLLTTVPGMPVTMSINVPAQMLGASSMVQIPPLSAQMPRPIPLTITARIDQGPTSQKTVSVF
jgi:hypothetical protein